jgi:Family of unknown function (DUF6459)
MTMSATITALPARPRASASTLPSIRVLPVPNSRPRPLVPGSPADALTAATAAGTAAAEAPQYIQDALAVDLASDEQLFGPQATARGDLPDPEHWAAHLAQAVVEVMAGARPATQILRWTTPEVYAVAARRNAVSARRGLPASRRATVRSVRVCEPADGVAEACAVVIDGDRVRALAMRLVGLDGRWRIEALQIG